MFPSTRQNLTHMLDVAVEVGVVRQAIVDNLGKVGHTFKCKVSSSVELISCGNQALGISQVTVSAHGVINVVSGTADSESGTCQYP